MLPTNYAQVTDSISIEENVETDLPLNVDVFDIVTDFEQPAMLEFISNFMLLNSSVLDSALMLEFTNELMPLNASVYDAVSLFDILVKEIEDRQVLIRLFSSLDQEFKFKSPTNVKSRQSSIFVESGF